MDHPVSFYLSNGVIDTALVAVLAYRLTNLFKPAIDHFFDPTRAWPHDVVMRLATLVLALMGTYALLWAGDQLHSKVAVVQAVLNALLAVVGAFGVYQLRTAGVPRTPTSAALKARRAPPGS